MRASRPILVGLVLTILLGASVCASNDEVASAPSNAPGGEESPPDTGGGTRTGGVAAEPVHDFTSFRGEGEMTTEKALQVFALVFGPVPGVEAPSDPALAFPGGSATGVIRDVFAHIDELTPEQRVAVRDHLIPEGYQPPGAADDPGGVVEEPGSVPDEQQLTGPVATPAAFLQSDEEDEARVRTSIDRAIADIQARTGSEIRPDVVVYLTRTATIGPDRAWAVSATEMAWVDAFGLGDAARELGITDPHGLAGPCVMNVADSALAGHDSEQVYSTIAHETFHCFQYRAFVGGPAAFNAMPGWVMEGSAGWVGEDLAHGSGIAIAQTWWHNYLVGLSGGYEMFPNDGYIAIGFWEYLDTSGADPWSKLLDVINQGGDAASFAFVTGDDVTLLAGWAASTVDASWAPDGAWRFEVTDQRPTSDRRSPAPDTLSHATHQVTAAAGGQAVRYFAPTADVEYATVEFNGPTTIVWAEDGPGLSTSVSSGKKAYCLISECVCPDGSLPFDGGFTSVGSDKELVVAATGTSAAAARVQVTGLTTEDVCEPCPAGESGSPSGEDPANEEPESAPRFAPRQDEGDSCPDPCPTGKWNLDTADLASQAGVVLAPATVTIEGGVVLDLDGTRSVVTYSDQMVAVRPMDAGLVMTMRFAWAGTSTGTYTAVMGNLTAAEESTDVTATINGDINGSPMPETGLAFPGGGSVFGGRATYQCLGDTMTTQTEGTPFHHTWHRINSPG